MKDLKDIIESMRHHSSNTHADTPSCYSSSTEESGIFDGVRGYLTLAASNDKHFGDAAYHAALEEGLQAEKLAASSAFADDRQIAVAFALHYLTDRFAAGHIRTNRNELSPRESKRRHDFDNHYGLMVVLSDGIVERTVHEFASTKDIGSYRKDHLSWTAFGDDCLLAGAASEHLAMVVAVATSAARRWLLGEQSTSGAEFGIEMGVPQLPALTSHDDNHAPVTPGNAAVPVEADMMIVTAEAANGIYHGPGFAAWAPGAALRFTFPSIMHLTLSTAAYQSLDGTTILVPVKYSIADVSAGLSFYNADIGWITVREPVKNVIGTTPGNTVVSGGGAFHSGADVRYLLQYVLPRGLTFAATADLMFFFTKWYPERQMFGISIMKDLN